MLSSLYVHSRRSEKLIVRAITQNEETLSHPQRVGTFVCVCCSWFDYCSKISAASRGTMDRVITRNGVKKREEKRRREKTGQ